MPSISIRRYTRADVSQMVERLEELLQQFHYGKIDFNAKRVKDMLIANLRNRGFFCDIVVADGEIVGVLCGSIVEFMFSYEVYAEHHITYIWPTHRSLAVITKLVRNYQQWARSRGVRQIRWGQSTGFKQEKFIVLAKRMGFTQIGTSWNMEVGR